MIKLYFGTALCILVFIKRYKERGGQGSMIGREHLMEIKIKSGYDDVIKHL